VKLKNSSFASVLFLKCTSTFSIFSTSLLESKVEITLFSIFRKLNTKNWVGKSLSQKLSLVMIRNAFIFKFYSRERTEFQNFGRLFFFSKPEAGFLNSVFFSSRDSISTRFLKEVDGFFIWKVFLL